MNNPTFPPARPELGTLTSEAYIIQDWKRYRPFFGISLMRGSMSTRKPALGNCNYFLNKAYSIGGSRKSVVSPERGGLDKLSASELCTRKGEADIASS